MTQGKRRRLSALAAAREPARARSPRACHLAVPKRHPATSLDHLVRYRRESARSKYDPFIAGKGGRPIEQCNSSKSLDTWQVG